MPRRSEGEKHYFTMDEAQALIQATDSEDVHLACLLMLRCGLRVSEAVAVRPSWLLFNQAPPVISIPGNIIGNKSKKAREVPIPGDLVDLVRLRASGKRKATNERLVGVSRQAVGQGIKRAAKVAGLDLARCHPHTLRHTYGRHCYNRGVLLNHLQLWMGHKNLRSTFIYVELSGSHHAQVNLI